MLRHLFAGANVVLNTHDSIMISDDSCVAAAPSARTALAYCPRSVSRHRSKSTLIEGKGHWGQSQGTHTAVGPELATPLPASSDLPGNCPSRKYSVRSGPDSQDVVTQAGERTQGCRDDVECWQRVGEPLERRDQAIAPPSQPGPNRNRPVPVSSGQNHLGYTWRMPPRLRPRRLRTRCAVPGSQRRRADQSGWVAPGGHSRRAALPGQPG